MKNNYKKESSLKIEVYFSQLAPLAPFIKLPRHQYIVEVRLDFSSKFGSSCPASDTSHAISTILPTDFRTMVNIRVVALHLIVPQPQESPNLDFCRESYAQTKGVCSAQPPMLKTCCFILWLAEFVYFSWLVR